MTNFTVRAFVASAIFLLVFALPSSAQVTTASVSGSVKDTQGGVIPGATLTLVSESLGTQSAEVFTNEYGDFVFANVRPDHYIVQVSMPGFKTHRRGGIIVDAGDHVGLGTINIEIGTVTDTVTVQSEMPLVQTQSAERSFTVATEAVQNLPISNRSFVQLATLTPGVAGTGTNPARLGGGGANNVMMDGVSTMDTGSNAILLQMNVESIAEVRVLASNYQAEFGRSSGLQITAVTKSGSNSFHGSAYSVMRDSKFNANNKTNIINGDPITALNEKDLGFSVGGPIGKPGGNNKLFFFYAQEFSPRTSSNAGGTLADVLRYRMPTALERQGDFSQTTDNNGSPYPYIKDPLLNGTCSATSQAACFQDGGVLGRIPSNRLYDTGLNILKMFPMPNVNVPGATYNYELRRPAEHLLAWQPVIRVDYLPFQKLRGSFKYSGWGQQNKTANGSIPGFNDTRQYKPTVTATALTVTYTANPTMFIEGTYGYSQNELAGCALAQSGTGPTFCTSAFPMDPIANSNTAGLGGLPLLFPDAGVINPSYYAYTALNSVKPPIWVNGRIVMPPSFSWGSRITNTPPNVPFPGYLNINSTDDISISLTKVRGRHTLKTGFYNNHSYKAQQRQGWAGTLSFANDTQNPLDSQFGYANAALGIFDSYNQYSKYIEGQFVYNNTEGYIQDNWKTTNNLTLDYGVRLIHQQPQYDKLGQASNFLPDKWTVGQAPLLYVAGCANNVYPCSGSNRQATDPNTGAFLGPTSAAAIGTLVSNSGNLTNGLFLSGQGIAKTTYTWPNLAIGPRFGIAYDMGGQEKIVLRGGMGLFFDRPSGNSIYPQVQNPPTIINPTVRYAQLQTLGTGGLTTVGAPALAVFEYAPKGLPASFQWNAGTQIALPGAAVLGAEWVGQHSYRTLQQVNLNGVDFGAAFQPQNQDRTLAASTTPGATAIAQDQMRAFRGYGAIQQQLSSGWRTFHSLQISLNRRFKQGVSFGFTDTISLYDHQSVDPVRLQHNPDGTYQVRGDQKQAEQLLGTYIANRHTLKGNFLWSLPGIHGTDGAMKMVSQVVNDWQLSGIWTGSTGTAYTNTFAYQNGAGSINLTGSPDYAARIRLVGNPGKGCSSDPTRQFNTAAFAGPLPNSLGLESGADYLRGCFNSVLDLSIVRNIRFGESRNFQFRLDMFNAPNASAVTGRNTTVNLASPTDPTNATNLPYNPDGSPIPSRLLPKTAGFGVATTYQAARTLQAQVRISF
jgi:hypothetical protein